MTTQTETLQTFAIDPSHSSAGFTVRHMGFSKVRGRFEQLEGSIAMDGEDLATVEAEATIQTQSITTNDQKRDDHLRSADFFEVEAYPTLTFKSTGVEGIQGNRFTLVGELTMHGVTRTVELDAEYLGEAVDPWGGTRVAFEAATTVNRKDYGLNWNAVLETGGLLVSDAVEITLELQAVRQEA